METIMIMGNDRTKSDYSKIKIKKAHSFEGTKLITIKKWKKEMGLF